VRAACKQLPFERDVEWVPVWLAADAA